MAVGCHTANTHGKARVHTLSWRNVPCGCLLSPRCYRWISISSPGASSSNDIGTCTSSTLWGICQEVTYLTRPYLHLNKSKKLHYCQAPYQQSKSRALRSIGIIVLLLYNKTPLSPYLSGFCNPYMYLSRRNFYSEKKPTCNYISDTASQSPVGLCLKIRHENLAKIWNLSHQAGSVPAIIYICSRVYDGDTILQSAQLQEHPV